MSAHPTAAHPLIADFLCAIGKNVADTADACRSIVDGRVFLPAGLIVAGGILIARAWGFL